jgi:diaminopimelate epimerase
VTTKLLKVEGAGNDFVLGTGGWADRIADRPEITIRLCDRRRGIGADGALALRVVSDDRVRVSYRNADGSSSAFCGNGTRCAARVAVALLGLPSRLTVVTGWAEIGATVAGDAVTLDLPGLAAPPRAVALAAGSGGWLLEVGVPHLVVAADDLAGLDLARQAPPLRSHRRLGPDGANVSFTEQEDDGVLAIRTYERGVEGETLCCGSAVVAAALVRMTAGGPRTVEVRARSGDRLTVEATGDPLRDPVRLTGPARIVATVEPSPELL